MASEEDSATALKLKGTPVNDLKIPDLKKELTKRGLSVVGGRSQLIERLQAQLLLEKLQQDAALSSGDELEGKAPNSALQDDKAGQNEFVRQYLQQQQRNLELQMEVKKQVEEERKRKSADESSADETNTIKKKDEDSSIKPDVTSAKKFKDDTINAPAKETKMPRPARKSSRNASKSLGENGQETEAIKEQSRSPSPENVRDRTRSGSSSSEGSPAPERSSRGRRGRGARGRGKKAAVGRKKALAAQKDSPSSSRSSSPEEVPKKKQRRGGNSRSSPSPSPSPAPDVPTRRSSQRASSGGQKSAVVNDDSDSQKPDSPRKVVSEEVKLSSQPSEAMEQGPQSNISNSSEDTIPDVPKEAEDKSPKRVVVMDNSPTRKVEMMDTESSSKKNDTLSQSKESEREVLISRKTFEEDESNKELSNNKQTAVGKRERSSSPSPSSQRAQSRSPSAHSSSSETDTEAYKSTVSSSVTAHSVKKVQSSPEKRQKIQPPSPTVSNKQDDVKINSTSPDSKPESKENQREVATEKPADQVEILPPAPTVPAEQADKTKKEKKRKWGAKGAKAATAKPQAVSMEISSDSLKGLIGEVKLTESVFDLEAEANNTLDYEEEQPEEEPCRSVLKGTEEETEEGSGGEDARVVQKDDKGDGEIRDVGKKKIKLSKAEGKSKLKKLKEDKENQELKRSNSKEAKMVATTRPAKALVPVVDEPERVRTSQSPARNPVGRVIRIACLVRPFTVNQLKALLRQSGELDDEHFWISDIKSHCLAAFKNKDDAVKARTALHGTRWPQSNPKILVVDFATIEDVEHRVAEAKGVPLPKPVEEPRRLLPPREVREAVGAEDRRRTARDGEETAVERRRSDKSDRGTERSGREDRQKDRDADRSKEGREGRGRDGERPTREEERRRRREDEKRGPPMREWDRDKIKQTSRSRSRSGEPRERRRSASRDKERERQKRRELRDEERRKEKKQKEAKAEEEPPAKLLDDLFRKTKATPCIYWLPLTEEQAIKRQMQREEEEKEKARKRAEREEKEKEEERKEAKRREERLKERQREREKERERQKQRDRSRDRGKERRARSSSSRSRSRSPRRRR